MHICNNQRLIISYIRKFIGIRGSTIDEILFSKKKVKIKLAKKNSSKDLMLTLSNIFYLLNSISNLIRLNFFNNAELNL